jgi:hypothetical protein
MSLTAVILGHVPFAAVTVPYHRRWIWRYCLISLSASGCILYLGVSCLCAGDLTWLPDGATCAAHLFAFVSITVLGVTLQFIRWSRDVSGSALLGIAARRADGLRNGRAATFALITGLTFIASLFQLIDGMGRGSQHRFCVLGGCIPAAASYLASRSRSALPRTYRTFGAKGAVCSGLRRASFATYAIVWAFTQHQSLYWSRPCARNIVLLTDQVFFHGRTAGPDEAALHDRPDQAALCGWRGP